MHLVLSVVYPPPIHKRQYPQLEGITTLDDLTNILTAQVRALEAELVSVVKQKDAEIGTRQVLAEIRARAPLDSDPFMFDTLIVLRAAARYLLGQDDATSSQDEATIDAAMQRLGADHQLVMHLQTAKAFGAGHPRL